MMPDARELADINGRFQPLFRRLRPGEGPYPLVIDQRAAQQVAMSHHTAGRDATLVQIGRKWNGKLPLDDLKFTIRYAPFVAGTTIIYDLLDETMQGKARPFVCDLTHRLAQIYLLLPFQVEQTSIAITRSDNGPKIEVQFLDAQQEIIQATIPFELRVSDSSGKLLTRAHAATNRLGRFQADLPPHRSKIVVHSYLTGRDESLTL